MAIAAKQEIDKGWDFTVKQVQVPHPVTGTKSGYFMNIREDTDEILGWTTERYGLVASSNALRLRPFGIHMKSKIDVAGWFLNRIQSFEVQRVHILAPFLSTFLGHSSDNVLDRFEGDLGAILGCILARKCSNLGCSFV